MKVEGRGDVVPSPIGVRLSLGEIRQIYELAKQRAEHRRYADGESKWERGLENGEDVSGIGFVRQAILPGMFGLIGEYAFAEFVNSQIPGACLELNRALTEYGDSGIDFTAFGLTIEVKTRKRPSGVNLVKYARKYGDICISRAAAFVFCQWFGEREVSLLGWQSRKCVLNRNSVRSTRDQHWNKVLADNELKSMRSLIFNLKTRRT